MTTNGPVQTCSLDDYPSHQPPLPSPDSDTLPHPLEMFKLVYSDLTIEDLPAGKRVGGLRLKGFLCSTMS